MMACNDVGRRQGNGEVRCPIACPRVWMMVLHPRSSRRSGRKCHLDSAAVIASFGATVVFSSIAQEGRVVLNALGRWLPRRS